MKIIFKNKALFFSIAFALLYTTITLAAPYAASDAMLNPTCAPGAADCYVTPTSIGGTVSSATAGSVFFAGTSGVLAQDNASLFFDDTNNRLGIGTATPGAPLEVKGVTSIASLGSEKTTNGTFDTDGSSWTATTWSAGSAKMNYTGTTGGIAVVSSSTGLGYSVNDVLTLTNGANDATVTVTSTFFGIITGVSITSAGTANTVTSNVAVTGGTGTGALINIERLVDSANTLSQDVSVTAGDTYQITYTVTRTAGELNLTLGGVSGHRVKASGTYTQTITATTTGNLIFTPTVDFSGSIDTISVKKVTGTSAVSSLINSDGTTGLEMRSGGSALYNTLVGYNAGLSNTTGTYNSAFGYKALFSNTTGTYNSAFGYQSLLANTTGNYNSASGYQSLMSNSTGIYNTAFGYQSLMSNTVAQENTAFGYQSLNLNTTGSNNTAFGWRALASNTTGYGNVAIGYALPSNTTGSENTAVGKFALGGVSGSGNTAVGYAILPSSNGDYNTGMGDGVFVKNTTGNNNTAVGYSAGGNTGTGYATYSNNTFFGYKAANNITTGADNNIVIGYDIDLPTAGGDNQLTIGNLIYGTTIDGTGTTVSTGKIGIGDATPDYRFDIDADVASYASGIFNDGNATTRSGLFIQAGLDDHTAAGPSTLIGFADGDGTAVGSITFGSSATAYNTTSDQRLKNLVNEKTTSSISLLNQIKIHDFTWKDDLNNNIYTGVFAQELYNVYPHAVTKPVDELTDNWMVDYSKLTPIIISSVQDIDTSIVSIENIDQDSSFVGNLRTWLASAQNGIEKLFAKNIETDKICFTNGTCVTGEQVELLLQNANQGTNSTGSSGDVSTTSGSESTTTTGGDSTTDSGSTTGSNSTTDTGTTGGEGAADTGTTGTTGGDTGFNTTGE